MDIVHQGVVTLLRSAVTGEKLPLPEGFELESAETLIGKQGLLPLAYQGAYRCGVDPKSEIMQRFQKKYFMQLMRSEQQMQKAGQIFKAFDENGIDYLPMKGCVLKKLYPQPEMRIMGDADILIRSEQYERIKPVMESLGFTEDVWSTYDVHWISRELLAELHYRLFSDNHEDLCGYFEDGWSKAVKTEGNRYEFTPEDTFLYIFSHMTKHFRFCGIGARQIVDLYVYRKAYPRMDEAKVEAVMAEMNLLKFYRNIKKLLEVWFEGAQPEPVTELIGTYVLSGGSFGTVENEMLSRELVRVQNEGAAQSSRGRSVWKMLFPPLSYLQLSYNVLYRHPWLQPAFWVIRWADILLHRRKNIARKLNVIRGITNEGIDRHRTLLQDMGLDYFA